jgi:hypothetical protein
MRLRDQVIGALNLFRAAPGPFDPVGMDQAFDLLRDSARSRYLRLSDLAQSFIEGSEPLMGTTSADGPQTSGGSRAPSRPRRRPHPGLPEPGP